MLRLLVVTGSSFCEDVLDRFDFLTIDASISGSASESMMMMGASLRFFEVELEVEGVGLEDEGIGLEDEGIGLEDEGIGLEDEGIGLEDEGIGLEDEGTGFMFEEVNFKLDKASFGVCRTAFELEEVGSTIRFFEGVDSTTVSAARRRFFCFFSLVSYNPITASVSYQYPRTREGTYRVNGLTIYNGTFLLLLCCGVLKSPCVSIGSINNLSEEKLTGTTASKSSKDDSGSGRRQVPFFCAQVTLPCLLETLPCLLDPLPCTLGLLCTRVLGGRGLSSLSPSFETVLGALTPERFEFLPHSWLGILMLAVLVLNTHGLLLGGSSAQIFCIFSLHARRCSGV